MAEWLNAAVLKTARVARPSQVRILLSPFMKPTEGHEGAVGEVAEWLKALVSKTGRVARPSWVQIPPSPLLILMLYDDVVNR